MCELTTDAKRTVEGVDGRYFIVQANGEICTRNASGKLTQFVFLRLASAQNFARRAGVRIWDKNAARFV